MRNAHFRTWPEIINLEKKKRNSHGRTQKMVRNNGNVENEKHTLQDPEYGKKPEKRGKGDKHCMIWNMARNSEKRGK